ncbi:hypothetical protein R3P38DRAFT_2557488, partial [Favolaschia claudopus]
PELSSKIIRYLRGLRKVGVSLSLLTIRGIMVAAIQEPQPQLFQRVMPDGSEFCCSESFVRKFLRNIMEWSQRASTRAAQKLPANHEKVLRARVLFIEHVCKHRFINLFLNGLGQIGRFLIRIGCVFYPDVGPNQPQFWQLFC